MSYEKEIGTHLAVLITEMLNEDPWAPTKQTKKRMTPEQKKALAAYRYAVQQEDRYLGSVFANSHGQREHEQKVAAAHQRCKQLGLGAEHGL